MPNAKSIRQISTILLATTLAGCASVSVKRVTSYDQEGIRYWRPAPYIALSKVTGRDGKGVSCQGTLMMLPDKSEEYAITMNSGLWGNASVKPALDNGWNLTSLDGKVETKTDTGINSLNSFLTSVASLGAKASKSKLQTEFVTTESADVLNQCSGFVGINYDPATGAIASFSRKPLIIDDALGVDISAGSPKAADQNAPKPGGAGGGTGQGSGGGAG
jgi:hypothetical protein